MLRKAIDSGGVAMIALGSGRADLSHTLGMRGRSSCVRSRSQLWLQRRHMLVVMNEKTLSRRAVVAGFPFLLAGCSGGYRSITPFVSIDPDLMRQEVAYGAPYRTGTVVVNIRERRLYLVQPGGRALRYAVGVGRAETRNFHGVRLRMVWDNLRCVRTEALARYGLEFKRLLSCVAIVAV